MALTWGSVTSVVPASVLRADSSFLPSILSLCPSCGLPLNCIYSPLGLHILACISTSLTVSKQLGTV